MKNKVLLIAVTLLLNGFAFADSWKNLEGNRIVDKWPGRGNHSLPKTACSPSAVTAYHYNTHSGYPNPANRAGAPIQVSPFDANTIYAFLRHDDAGTVYLLLASVQTTSNAYVAINRQWNSLKVEPAQGGYQSVFSAAVSKDWYNQSQVLISIQDSFGQPRQLILPLKIVDQTTF